MQRDNNQPDAGDSLVPVPSTQLSMSQDLDGMVQVAQLMAKSKIALPKHFHNSPGECLAVVMQARDWNMNPYSVGQKTSIINNRLMYEGQLVQAAINKSGILDERFSFTFEGEGEALVCTAAARIRGDKEPKIVKVGMPKPNEPRNSPLWKTDPEQQLTYKACRVWVRRYAPEILLGVYTPEDDWSEREQAPEISSRLAALESQPGEPVNVIEGNLVKEDPFAEGATVPAAGSTTAGTIIDQGAQAVEHPNCYECLDKGIEGGCPSCGKEPVNGEG